MLIANKNASTRTHRGQYAYLSGAAAEQAVAREYLDQGYQIVAERWRCAFGEVDLIVSRDGAFVFVEVKKSQRFESAALRITQRQSERIFAAASLFVAELPQGQLTPMRFDAALVDGIGQVEIRENALFLC